jgi:hypothetical protein
MQDSFDTKYSDTCRTIIEKFDYEKHQQEANNILALMIPFLTLTYILSLLAMIYLFQKKKYALFYVVFILLICPFLFTQILVFFLSLYVVSRYFFAIDWSNLPLVVIVSSFVLYVITSYILVSLCIYLFGNVTLFETQHPELFHENFVKSPALEQLKILDKKSRTNIEALADDGRQTAKQKKIVFAFLSKNSEKHIPSMRQKLAKLGKQFKDYHVVLFENDSIGGSREMFEQWQKVDDHFTLLDCCSLGNCNCKLNWQDASKMKGIISTTRIKKMRFMRQYVLDYIKQQFADWDYLAVMDFDLKGAIFEDGFFTTFSKMTGDFDMTFAAGYTTVPIFNSLLLYDGIAYQSVKKSNALQKGGDVIKCLYTQLTMNRDLLKFPTPLSTIKCKSGFNGIAIYAMNSVKDASYDKTDHICEHVDLHLDMIKNGKDKIYYNPIMILFVGQQGPTRKSVLFKK